MSSRGFRLALVVALAACAELPLIESNVCGNGVVEEGEDCDLYADPALGTGLGCAAPTDPTRACRYACGAGFSCPTGWGCGPDGVCRYASGGFVEAPGSPMGLKGDQITTGDVDGDRHPDVLAVGWAELEARFGAVDGTFPAEHDAPIDFPQGPPAFGDLDGDQRLDVVLPLTAGLTVLLGQADRTLAPVAYAPFAIPSPPGGIQVLPIRADLQYPGEHALLLTSDGSTFIMQFFEGEDGTPASATIVPGSHDVSQLAGRVPVANVDANPLKGQEELALAFSGTQLVYVYGPTKTFTERLTLELRDTVALPKPILYGARFADIDGDGNLDLMVSVQGDFTDEVAVALGDGLGGFGLAIIDDTFQQLGGSSMTDPIGPGIVGGAWPVAVGDLNFDGVADYVSQHGVHLRWGNQLFQSFWRSTPNQWVEAEIADFNRDYLPDIAAAGEADGIDFLVGTGTGIFNRSHIDTDDPPFALRAGDYDGDLVLDLAIGQHGQVAGDAVDTLAILFGDLQGAPSAPVSMGRMQLIQYMEPGLFFTDYSSLDLTTDLVVQSFASYEEPDQRSLAIMLGSSQRRMLSPFALQVDLGTGTKQTDIPLAVQIGRFDPSGDTIPDLVAVAPPRVWLVKGAGGALFTAQDAQAVEVDKLSDGSFESWCAAWTSGDVDGDGDDEVVAIDYSARCGGGWGVNSHLLVAGITAGSGVDAVTTDLGSDWITPISVSLVDLNGDTLPELVVPYLGDQGAAAIDGSGEFTVPKAGVVVYWNGESGFDLAAPSVAPLPANNWTLQGAVALNVDGDPALEIVFLADQGVYVAKLDGTDYVVPEAPALPAYGLGPVLAEDVNADGLDDLLFRDASGVALHVFLSIPNLQVDERLAP